MVQQRRQRRHQDDSGRHGDDEDEGGELAVFPVPVGMGDEAQPAITMVMAARVEASAARFSVWQCLVLAFMKSLLVGGLAGWRKV